MDQLRPPFPHNLPPVNQNINESSTQESTFNWPPGFVFPPTQFQQAQVAQAAAYAAYLRQLPSEYQPTTQHHVSGTQPHSTYFQPWFPTSCGVENPVNVDAPVEASLVQTSTVPRKVSNRNVSNKKNTNWTHIEDKTLCEAWVQRSENPVIGNNQTGDSFWMHIFEDFRNKLPETKRSKRGVEGRWGSIQLDVTKWKATMDRIRRNHQSGTNSVDELGAAYKLFKDLHDHDFKMYHCWEILQHSPKWHQSLGERENGQPSSRSGQANVTLPPASPHESINTGLDGLQAGGDDSQSHATATGPTPSSIRSQPIRKRPPGRTSTKEKDQQVAAASVRNNSLSDKVSEWIVSQDAHAETMVATSKSQFEAMKADNELKTFHYVKKKKFDQLNSAISCIKAIADTEANMVNEVPQLKTAKLLEDRISRFKKLKEIEREIYAVQQLEYSSGGSESRQMNHGGGNMDPVNLENSFSVSIDSDEED